MAKKCKLINSLVHGWVISDPRANIVFSGPRSIQKRSSNLHFSNSEYFFQHFTV